MVFSIGKFLYVFQVSILENHSPKDSLHSQSEVYGNQTSEAGAGMQCVPGACPLQTQQKPQCHPRSQSPTQSFPLETPFQIYLPSLGFLNCTKNTKKVLATVWRLGYWILNKFKDAECLTRSQGWEKEGGLEPPAICISLVPMWARPAQCPLGLPSLLRSDQLRQVVTTLLEKKSLWKCMCWVFIAFLNTLSLLKVNDCGPNEACFRKIGFGHNKSDF